MRLVAFGRVRIRAWLVENAGCIASLELVVLAVVVFDRPINGLRRGRSSEAPLPTWHGCEYAMWWL